MVASDPGLGRLRMAVSGAVAMATALGVEYGFATLLGADAQGVLISMLLGAIVAMMGSLALTGSDVGEKVRTAVWFPVAIGGGMVAGIAVAGSTGLMLSVFVVVMFLAVFVRRWGPAFFNYGFMAWMGYFFASFLHPSWSMMPMIVGATVVGTAWVLLLSITLLNTHAPRTLRRVVRAFDARARAVARAGSDLLTHADRPDVDGGRARRRARRALGRRQTRLAEVALMVEAWSAERGALPEGWSGPALRRRLIDAQQAVDGIVAGADSLAAGGSPLAGRAAVLLDRMARRDDAGAERAARELADATGDDTGTPPPGRLAARHLAAAASEFVALARIAEAPPGTAEVDDFEPAVGLAMGHLPGSPAVALDVPVHVRWWNPLAKLDMTTRQAIQVAVAGTLAILVGRELSDTRYYWAVIAVFVMFTGTGTRSETFLKGVNRLVGTLLGLFASIWLAGVTAGSTTAVLVTIVACMFVGFYMFRISYGFMIFCITIMVGQLYSALHEFSNALLVLRLEETAVGALIGFAVAVLVLPLGTRHTVRTVRGALFTALSELLVAVAQRLETGRIEPAEDGTPRDLDGLARGLDDRFRRLALVARPLTRPLVWGHSPSQTRHRLALLAAAVTHARALTVGVRGDREENDADVATACRALAVASDRLAGTTPGYARPDAAEPLTRADVALFGGRGDPPGTWVTDPVRSPLIHLHDLLAELAQVDGRARGEAGGPDDPRTPDVAAALAVAAGAPRPDGDPQRAFAVASLTRALRRQLDEVTASGGPAPDGWWFADGTAAQRAAVPPGRHAARVAPRGD
ncbi:FUSC family protein [Pseudonocardia sediminis]|uniref:FUSC family protein n=1 Tax=Pseudonocardia sediminis TaxID=1397368 RepID=UPI0010288405|nr:FUSC family protein [Pseudonocardia sediminis]